LGVLEYLGNCRFGSRVHEEEEERKEMGANGEQVSSRLRYKGNQCEGERGEKTKGRWRRDGRLEWRKGGLYTA
jgi:hypothetical protein